MPFHPLYLILKNLKPEKIHLVEFNFLPLSGMSNWSYLPPKYVYKIEKNINEEEQIIALLHEMIHGLPKYLGKSTFFNYNKKIEREITDGAQTIYNNRPTIREYVRTQLRLAKTSQTPRIIKKT